MWHVEGWNRKRCGGASIGYDEVAWGGSEVCCPQNLRNSFIAYEEAAQLFKGRAAAMGNLTTNCSCISAPKTPPARQACGFEISSNLFAGMEFAGPTSTV